MTKYHGVYALDLFLRDNPAHILPFVALMAAEPEANKSVVLMLRSAKQGNCVKDCGPCGKPIKSVGELAGFAYFRGQDDRNDKPTALLAAVCQSCASLGPDIVISRYSDLLKKKLFNGELVAVPDPTSDNY